MKLSTLDLPRPVPLLPERPPQATIPRTRAERERLQSLARAYVTRVQPVPPLSLEELRAHTGELLSRHGVDEVYRDYAGVVLSNEVWREQLAAVPYERRLLLLPKCLRVEDKCPAPFDEFGLLCKRCGLCTIQDLQEEAERLGYAVLVAEGSALVMAIIETGKIDAIVGVSCLSVLERAFPYMETAAIPGVAVPLLQDDCRDTTVDLDWVWDYIHLTRDDKTRRLDLEALRRRVAAWFEPEALESILGPTGDDVTLDIARRWLAGDGKRWRPFLAVCVYRALQENPEAPLPEDLRRIAVAIECFHKASLVHDDIEDEDPTRYGVKTLHRQHGVAVALNVGDLLVGEGYRLLAQCGAPAAVKARMLEVAALAHGNLCLGQGAELWWARSARLPAAREVLDSFRKKTSPAFEVALGLGALYAGCGGAVLETLHLYSQALGVAYQIRDDLEDLADLAEVGPEATSRPEGSAPQARGWGPSLPLAMVYERCGEDERAVVEKAWSRGRLDPAQRTRIAELVAEHGVDERCRGLLEAYKEEAVRSLAGLESSSLKGLLRRVIGKVFRLEIQGWCREFETRNAAGGETLAQAAG